MDKHSPFSTDMRETTKMSLRPLSVVLTDAYAREYERGHNGACMLLNHAVSLAREAEYEADRAANLAQAHTEPAYPVWMRLLAGTLDDDTSDAKQLIEWSSQHTGVAADVLSMAASLLQAGEKNWPDANAG